jgi:transcriptional regulator with PAS, ATPase and Fis domain
MPALDQAERTLLEGALSRSGQNRSAAAKDLGIPRSSLIYKLKRFGLG